MNIGPIIKKLRKKLKLSQLEFAELIEISQTYLSQLENGKAVPAIKVLDRISYELKIPVAVIMFQALDRESVTYDKRELYDQLKPTIDGFLDTLYPIEKI